MAQMRIQVTPAVTDNLQEAETAFVYLLRTTSHIKHSVASPIEKRSHSHVNAKFKMCIYFPCTERYRPFKHYAYFIRWDFVSPQRKCQGLGKKSGKKKKQKKNCIL